MSTLLRRAVSQTLRHYGWQLHRVRSPLQYLASLLRRHRIDLVFDVGANTGQFASEIRKAGYEGQIVSFEPVSSAHAELSVNANRDRHWTVAPRMALGCQEGEVTINVSRFSPASSILPICEWCTRASPELSNAGSETVPCHCLDNVAAEYLRPNRRSLLKLDVQGFEKQVLDGAGAALPQLSGVYLEISLSPVYEGQALAWEMLNYLQARNMDLWYLMPGFEHPRTGRLLQMDALLFRAGIEDEERQSDD